MQRTIIRTYPEPRILDDLLTNSKYCSMYTKKNLFFSIITANERLDNDFASLKVIAYPLQDPIKNLIGYPE